LQDIFCKSDLYLVALLWKIDLQLRGSYESSPPCILNHIARHVCYDTHSLFLCPTHPLTGTNDVEHRRRVRGPRKTLSIIILSHSSFLMHTHIHTHAHTHTHTHTRTHMHTHAHTHTYKHTHTHTHDVEHRRGVTRPRKKNNIFNHKPRPGTSRTSASTSTKAL